jgi:acyl-coenzyme A synthetase/AMP-(fatty) acid ligase
MIKEEMPYLRLIILSGEQCPHELVDEWANKNRRLLNVYGPTETTVNATVKECKPGQPVTIGKAIEGYKLYIIDENKKIVDKGKEGELYIGGSGLARGYLNLESLTKSTFIENLLNNKDSRLYKTGDLVKENENCELIFLGRIDTQVKVRGYRIELLEIEKILLEHECIESAVVTVSQHRQTPELVAYIITSGSSVNQDEILKLLKNRLPAYMIPNYLEVIDEFPRLTSGKIDRKNLPRPQNPLIAMDRT